MHAMSAEPTRSELLDLDDGRQLAWAEFGEPGGRPAILLHGAPGSRLACPDVAATVTAGVRLITFDRPGTGGSDPHPFHRLTDVVADLVELADALGLPPCPVLGWSSGASFALACGATHPERFPAVGLVSGSAAADDPELVAERSPERAALVARLRGLDPGALAEVEGRFAFYADDPTVLIARTLADADDPDRHLMAEPEVAAALATMWREGARQGATGVAGAWVAQWALGWGFTPEAVTVPVHSWHGTEDRIVPFAQAERLARRLPAGHLHAIEGGGHLVALDHWTAILDTMFAAMR